nr:putative ribonuclease H-like domain-containing protein [Tanacetum cinerariifolium]
GNPNPTASTTNPQADPMETLAVEILIPNVSSPVPTACLNDSQKPSSDTRIISKRVAKHVETPSLDNILTLTNRFKDILGVTTNLVDSDGVEAKEEGIDYDEVFGPVVRIEAIRLFLAYASFMGFTVYQMDVKSAFLYVKRIFRYLKGHPKLGLWYPKESPFDLVAYSDSNYGGASQDRKSTTRGCQFLGRRLISWQCKTIVSTSTTEAEYVVAASGCGQVLWIQNQLLDYGYNFMNTKIYIDNNSAICIVKNPVYHSKTKHKEIRHHFIRDCFEKKLISVDHIHADENVADLLTKLFDVGRFQYLVCKIFPLLGQFSTVSVFLGFGLTFAGTSKYWGVLRILMISLRLSPLVSKGSVTMTASFGCITIEARFHTAKTIGLVWIWLGGDYGNVFIIAFCDYHNMIAILEKFKHNQDFHQIVDFVEASHIRYALTFNPTVYVSHIRQFWSTARIETTEEGTKILSTVD